MIGIVGGSLMGSIGADGATSIGLVLLVGRSVDVKKVGRGCWCCRDFERKMSFMSVPLPWRVLLVVQFPPVCLPCELPCGWEKLAPFLYLFLVRYHCCEKIRQNSKPFIGFSHALLEGGLLSLCQAVDAVE
jgi:hypothetical protein